MSETWINKLVHRIVFDLGCSTETNVSVAIERGLLKGINEWYDEWEKHAKEVDPVGSSDDYYWHGVNDFKNFIEEKLK